MMQCLQHFTSSTHILSQTTGPVTEQNLEDVIASLYTKGQVHGMCCGRSFEP